MKRSSLYAIVLSIAFISCNKHSDTPADPPTKGSISGHITPAGAVTGITVAGTLQNSITYTTKPDASGFFEINGMMPGEYRIAYANAAMYMAHADDNTLIIAGRNNELGKIAFQQGGVISGTISPLKSVMYVKATNTQNAGFGLGTPDAADGSFKTSALEAGNYEVVFSPVYGYRSPDAIRVSVAAGQRIDLGAVAMLPNMLGGIPFTPSTGPDQRYSAPNLSVSAIYRVNGAVGGGQDFTIAMDDITAPGTYICRGTPASGITYTIAAAGGPFGMPARTWSTGGTGAEGKVVVTSVDRVKKEIKGTFSATLVCNKTGEADVVIKDGSFYFSY